ncbi:MAG TPA: hypothetical protein VHT23_08410 [Gemmatimonadaceae bacterium]|nr:hypothetical protein [Gemmatimonadaceae bacterium]
MATFPFFEVLNYETGSPVTVAVWHVRSIRPIREMADDNETLTRIEYANGDCLDTSDSVGHVLNAMHAALDPVMERLVTPHR